MELSLLSSQLRDPDKFLSQERSRLQRLQLRSTVILGAIVSFILVVQDTVERYREIVLFTDGVAVTVESHIDSAHSAYDSLDEHLASYRAKVNKENGEFGKTASIFILDKSGRIVSTSIPSWKGYKIYDRSIRNTTNENALLKKIIDCHEYASNDIFSSCRNEDFVGASYIGNLITTSKYLMPTASSGQHAHLLIVNYDMSSLYEGLLEEATLIFFFSFSFSYLVYAVPSRYLRIKLLPRLSKMIQIDSLTGCSDRSSFVHSALISLELGSARSAEMMLVLFDIASFKEVNSKLGPSKSDVVLTMLANTIIENINQEKDLLGRLESDKFIALLSTSNRILLDSIAYQFELTTRSMLPEQVGLKCNMGCVLTSSHGYNLDFLMSRASRALLEAKKGSDSYVIYGQEDINHALS